MLFIALLVMVALSLAGIALLRSADTATIVAGNLAFKQSAAAAVDRSIEQAVEGCSIPSSTRCGNQPGDRGQDRGPSRTRTTSRACRVRRGRLPGCRAARFPRFRTILDNQGRPRRSTWCSVDAAGNNVYYVIERMCANAGAAVGSNCNLSAAGLGADAGTQHYEASSRPGDAYYRVTVRVEGPRNTVPVRAGDSQVAHARSPAFPGAAP